MTDITIPYGKSTISASIPDKWPVVPVMPKQVAPVPDPMNCVMEALNFPLNSKLLEECAPIGHVAIAINDKTRPVPHEYLLPPLLEKLHRIGAASITFFIATGSHPVMPSSDYSMILPQSIIDQFPINCHDAEEESSHTYLGKTSRGTPVYINKGFMDADFRIVIGNIEPHQFMGFSGGVKSAAIGLAGKITINHNHSMMTHTHARLGHYETNPARQDVEEIGQMIRVDFALNALLNDKKQIVETLAGDPQAVMVAAIPKVQEMFQVSVNKPFDLIIASPGGHPKDINMYQAQKGIAHAALALKDGGTVILCAACTEGTGSQSYEDWVRSKDSHEDVFTRFENEGFRVGPHKAFQISRDAARVNVMLISEMESDFVRSLLLHPFPGLQAAIDTATKSLPDNAHIGIMHAANTTIPILIN